MHRRKRMPPANHRVPCWVIIKDPYSSFLSDFKSNPIIILKIFLVFDWTRFWPIRVRYLISFGVGIGGETHLSISFEWYPLEAVESIGEVFEIWCIDKSLSDWPIFGSSIVNGGGGGAVERGDFSKSGAGLGRYAGPYVGPVDRHAGVEKCLFRPSENELLVTFVNYGLYSMNHSLSCIGRISLTCIVIF